MKDSNVISDLVLSVDRLNGRDSDKRVHDPWKKVLPIPKIFFLNECRGKA